MALHRELFKRVHQAAKAIDAAEKSVLEAQEGFRVAIRRLHIAGVPLRDIAAELHLSHQRVHQLVEGQG